jgi:hypothetical protein
MRQQRHTTAYAPSWQASGNRAAPHRHSSEKSPGLVAMPLTPAAMRGDSKIKWPDNYSADMNRTAGASPGRWFGPGRPCSSVLPPGKTRAAPDIKTGVRTGF